MKLLSLVVPYVMVGIVFIISALPAFAGSMALPSGWRAPISSELNDDWRNKDPDKYSVVSGDFNGDGVEDRAMLLVSIRRHYMGLFVFLSQKSHTFKVYPINVIKDVTFLQVMGINKVLPGKYKTACGKGYWKCKKGELSEISVSHEAINYFKTEGANSYLYWDEQEKKFKKIWMSD